MKDKTAMLDVQRLRDPRHITIFIKQQKQAALDLMRGLDQKQAMLSCHGFMHASHASPACTTTYSVQMSVVQAQFLINLCLRAARC